MHLLFQELHYVHLLSEAGTKKTVLLLRTKKQYIKCTHHLPAFCCHDRVNLLVILHRFVCWKLVLRLALTLKRTKICNPNKHHENVQHIYAHIGIYVLVLILYTR